MIVIFSPPKENKTAVDVSAVTETLSPNVIFRDFLPTNKAPKK